MDRDSHHSPSRTEKDPQAGWLRPRAQCPLLRHCTWCPSHSSRDPGAGGWDCALLCCRTSNRETPYRHCGFSFPSGHVSCMSCIFICCSLPLKLHNGQLRSHELKFCFFSPVGLSSALSSEIPNQRYQHSGLLHRIFTK